MSGIVYGIYRLQQRRITALASAPISVPVSQPLTIDLSPHQVELVMVAETVLPIEPMPLEITASPSDDTLIETESDCPDDKAEELTIPTIPEVQPDLTGDRSQIVMALLDEAYLIGKTTYPELIAYVEKHTGKGCSRRVISNWKKARKLVAAESEAA